MSRAELPPRRPNPVRLRISKMDSIFLANYSWLLGQGLSAGGKAGVGAVVALEIGAGPILAC